MYQYITNCVNCDDVERLNDMIDDAEEISADEFFKYVDEDELNSMFGYDEIDGLSIDEDYAVSFYESEYKGMDCVYVAHSGIALIFARTETKGFHREIWNKADAVFFFKGRLKFYHADGTQGGTANAPSCLVAYGKDNVQALEDCGLEGKLVYLY